MNALLTILSLVALLIGLAATGLMTAEMTAGMLVALVILLALVRNIGSGLGAAVFWVGLPLLSIVALAVHHSGGSRDAAVAIVAQLGVLGLTLFGLYLIVSAPFRR